MAFRNILLPLDVNDLANADRALQDARFLAEAAGATVHLLHVRLYLPLSYVDFLPSSFDQEEKESCMEQLRAWKASLGLPEDRVTITLRRGPVPGEVLDEAAKREADLIIIGSRQPSMSTRLLGSNAASIIRDAKISVLVTRRQDQRETA